MKATQPHQTRAQYNRKSKSTNQQPVTFKTEGQTQYIAIEPASPTEIYVPYYEPAVVYGAWPYPDYAPYYFPPPYGYFGAGVLATGVAFAAGIAIRHAFWGRCDWGRRHISVLPSRVGAIGSVARGTWQHNPAHRHG